MVYYFRAHKLVLHPDKIVFMLFTSLNISNLGENAFIDKKNFEGNCVSDLKTPVLCVNILQSPKVKFLGILIHI